MTLTVTQTVIASYDRMINELARHEKKCQCSIKKISHNLLIRTEKIQGKPVSMFCPTIEIMALCLLTVKEKLDTGV
jgi:hypothetical protein